VAFVRVCSGQFVRGSTVIHGPTGRPFATKYAASVFGADRITVDEAWPGDVVGLVNASGLKIGDTLYIGEPVAYPRIPAFPPELLASARSKDVSRSKQFRRGVEQLEQEGVVQVLARRDGEQTPVLAAVGQMQFDVFAYRMQNEFGAEVELSPPMSKSVRITDEATAEELKSYRGAQVLLRRDGALLAFFDSPYLLDRLETDHPAWMLHHIVTT
jgi:peptide chain release factor 3